MFKPRAFPGFGQASPAALVGVLTPASAAPAAAAHTTLLARLRAVDLAQVDWAPDLAEAIGSRRWFRGLFTMLGLILAALALWPDANAMAAPPAMPLDSGGREEFRSQMIQPLALGGDSGSIWRQLQPLCAQRVYPNAAGRSSSPRSARAIPWAGCWRAPG